MVCDHARSNCHSFVQLVPAPFKLALLALFAHACHKHGLICAGGIADFSIQESGSFSLSYCNPSRTPLNACRLLQLADRCSSTICSFVVSWWIVGFASLVTSLASTLYRRLRSSWHCLVFTAT